MQALQSYRLNTGSGKPVTVSYFGSVDYQDSFSAMQEYANARSDTDPDQIWLLEHPPVYTQGTACDLDTFVSSDIPVVKTDRGGQITYHGPGQIVMYPLLHLRNHNIGVKTLVESLEQCVIDYLAAKGIEANRKEKAPGVYVDGAKIAALGLRIRRGNSYHGLSFNVDMDLTPFLNIDPCGYQGLKVTQLSDVSDKEQALDVGQHLVESFINQI